MSENHIQVPVMGVEPQRDRHLGILSTKMDISPDMPKYLIFSCLSRRYGYSEDWIELGGVGTSRGCGYIYLNQSIVHIFFIFLRRIAI